MITGAFKLSPAIQSIWRWKNMLLCSLASLCASHLPWTRESKGESCPRSSYRRIYWSMSVLKTITMSNQRHFPVTTIASIIKRFRVHWTTSSLPGCKRKRRRMPGVDWSEGAPTTPSKSIQAELQGQGTSLFDQTIHHILKNTVVHEINIQLEFTKMHVYKPPNFGVNIFWTDETKLELF